MSNLIGPSNQTQQVRLDTVIWDKAGQPPRQELAPSAAAGTADSAAAEAML
ncbi:MAG: hypothetical protein ABL974_15545 [Prosthecobacter sp.]